MIALGRAEYSSSSTRRDIPTSSDELLIVDVDKEGDPYLNRFEHLFLFQSRSLLALTHNWCASEQILIIFSASNPTKADH